MAWRQRWQAKQFDEARAGKELPEAGIIVSILNNLKRFMAAAAKAARKPQR